MPQKSLMWFVGLLSFLILFPFTMSSANDSIGLTVLWEYGEENNRQKFVKGTLLGYNNESEALIDYSEYDLEGNSIKILANITAEYFWKSSEELASISDTEKSIVTITVAEEEVVAVQFTNTYSQIDHTYSYDNNSGVLVDYESTDGTFTRLLSWTDVNVADFAASQKRYISGYFMLVPASFIGVILISIRKKNTH